MSKRQRKAKQAGDRGQKPPGPEFRVTYKGRPTGPDNPLPDSCFAPAEATLGEALGDFLAGHGLEVDDLADGEFRELVRTFLGRAVRGNTSPEAAELRELTARVLRRKILRRHAAIPEGAQVDLPAFVTDPPAPVPHPDLSDSPDNPVPPQAQP